MSPRPPHMRLSPPPQEAPPSSGGSALPHRRLRPPQKAPPSPRRLRLSPGGPAPCLNPPPCPPQRLCLNGSTGQEVVVRKDLQNVEALSFDPVSRLLYWVDAGAQKIEVTP